MNRRFTAALAGATTVAVLVVGSFVSPAATAAPSAVTGARVEFDPVTPFYLINLGTDQAVELSQGGMDPDELLRQTPLTYEDHLAWYVSPVDGRDGVFTFKNASTSVCLQRVLTEDGQTVVRPGLADGQTDQEWVLNPLGRDLYTIGVPGTDQVLEVGADADDPGLVTVGTSRAQLNQQWSVSAKNPVLITPRPSRAANSAGWRNEPLDVTLAASEYFPSQPSPLVQWRTSYKSDWADASQGVRVASEGKTVLSYRALRGGSVAASSEGFTVIQIDSVAPVVSAVTTPASGTVAAGGKASATFIATDATSGIDHIEYSIDGGATWVRGAGVSFRDAGTHAVAYRAVDVAGNVATTKTLNLTVQAPPSASATVTSADPAPTADGWYQKDVAVALVAPQAGQQLQYRLYGSDWKNYTGPVKVARNGVSQLDSRLVVAKKPVAGSEASVTVKVDKVVPAVTAARTPSSGKGTPAKPVSVTFTPKDLHSGVAKVEYRVNSGAWATASAPVVFDKVGSSTVQYRATDVAGNVSAVRSVPVTITAG